MQIPGTAVGLRAVKIVVSGRQLDEYADVVGEELIEEARQLAQD